MAKKKKSLLSGVHPAVISVWAALIATAHLLPAIALIGVGGTLSVATCLLPLAGIFFGPVAGGLCAAIGSFIGDLIAPSGAWLGMFTFLVPTADAVIAGLVSLGRKTGLIAIGLSVLGLLLWFAQEIGRKAWIFAAIFGGYGLLACVIGMFVCNKFLLKKNPLLKSIAIFICGVSGMVGAAMLADCVSIYLFKTPAITWKVLAPVAPVERTVFSVASMIIGTPLLVGLPKIGIFVGPRDPKELEEEEGEGAEENAALSGE